MTPNAKKPGRRRVPYTCPWNDTKVNGLYQKPNTNVWRIVEGERAGFEFRENDPREAVRRFYELTEPQRRVPKVEMGSQPSHRMVYTDAELADMTFSVEGGWRRLVPERDYIDRMRKDLLERPQWVAEKTGVEWVGWHEHLKPVKADTLEDLGEVYFTHNGLSPNELSRSKCFWAEFVKVAQGRGVTTIDGVDHELGAGYESWVGRQGLSPKSKLHRYRKVRGILHFAIKRGKSVEHCRKALDCLAFLQVKDAHPLDPTPISPKDYWKIYAQAVKAGDPTYASLLLTSLNAALYGGEVAAVKWSEINLVNGGFVSRRSKTGVSRIAMLWPEVVAAIRALPRERDEVFVTSVRSYTVHSVSDRFERYRDAAGVAEEVTFSWIRDAAYSIALGASDFSRAELLAGHRLPSTSDHYLRRNPQLVSAACQAIGKAFDVARQVKKLNPTAE